MVNMGDNGQGKEKKDKTGAGIDDRKENNTDIKDLKEKTGGINDPVIMPPVTGLIICPNCKQKVQPKEGMCPECRHYVGEGKTLYQPLSEKTKKRVRLILTVIFLGVFIALVAFGVVRVAACEHLLG